MKRLFRRDNVRVNRVHRDLIFCGIADETLVVGEGDIRGGGAVTLVVGDDLYTIVLPDTDAAVEKKSQSPSGVRGKRTAYE
jgi:hypothetical protein